jgi:hypothetical protein
MDDPIKDPNGFYVRMHNTHDQLLKRQSKSIKVCISLLILNALVCFLFQKNPWLRGGTVMAIIVMAYSIYSAHKSMMKLYQIRVMIMNDLLKMLAEMGSITVQVFGEKIIELNEKYNDKKARLEDLIGPDFEEGSEKSTQ